MRVTIHPQYEHLRNWIEQLPTTFFQQGEVIYDARNQIRSMQGPDGKDYNVKRYHQPIWINRVIYSFLRETKAQRAYDNAKLLLEKGIPTPAPIAYLLVYNEGLLAESFLITEQSPLRHRFYEIGFDPQPEHEGVMQEFARFTAQLHESQILHLDYSPGNILWDITDDGKVEFSLVDINRIRFAPVSFEEGCKAMQRLWGSEDTIAQLGRDYAAARGHQPADGAELLTHQWRLFWKKQKRCPFSPISTRVPQKVVVVIPVYKKTLNEDEILSVNQCLSLLSEYDIRFVGPDSLPYVNGYEQLTIEHFPDEYFTDVAAYNRLMLSTAFYERFLSYDYMLIHQTDAYLFRNELRHWVQMGYPYIGAPWILKEKYRKCGKLLLHLRSIPYRLTGKPFWPLILGDRIGNGGLSLRRIHSFYTICNEQEQEIKIWIEKSRTHSEFNEDCFWSCRPGWAYPPAKEALTFSVDIRPTEALRQLNGHLPMGCHGWSKGDYRKVWEKAIPMTKRINVYYDYQAFSHQQYGGVSRIFAELIQHLPKDIIPYIGLRYSDNIYIKALKPDIMPEDPQKGLFFKAMAHLFPRLYPYPKYANRAICKKEIQRSDFDILHATYFDTYVMKRANRVPLVITIHDMIDEILGGPQRVPKRKALLARKATHIIAVSEQTKADIIRLLDIAPEKITVIYHASTPLIKIPQKAVELPERYVLYVGGRSRSYKNWSLFIEAMIPILQKEDLFIVCIGPSFTPKETAWLNKLGIASRVQCHFAEEDQLYTFYHNAQCFVYPSCYEGFGLPILEAWQSECPIVLSRSSCFPEIAQDAACYNEENDVNSLTQQITQVLERPELRHELIQKGLRRLNDFSWEKSAQQLAEVYKKILQHE